MDLANLRGGPDNITVVIVRVKGALDHGQPRARCRPCRRRRRPARPSRDVDRLGGPGGDRTGAVGVAVTRGRAWSSLGGRGAGRRGGGPASDTWRQGPVAVERAALGTRAVHGYPAVAQRRVRQPACLGGPRASRARPPARTGRWTGAASTRRWTGAAASQAGDYAQAVRQYCQAISFLMAELKRQRHTGGAMRRGR